MTQPRKSPRAGFINYDYGDYFITTCTQNRKQFFGEIIDGEMLLNDVGRFLDKQLLRCSEFTDKVTVLQHVVMPNHLHAIVSVDAPISIEEMENGMDMRNPNPMQRIFSEDRRHIPLLSKYVNSLKGAVTKFAKAHIPDFGWQSRYYDHLIRGTNDAKNISEYIDKNISNWPSDEFNT